jgi:transcriptional regulator with XRE-family HTH domain
MPDYRNQPQSVDPIGVRLARAAEGAKTIAEYARRLAGKSQADVASAAGLTERRLNLIEFGAPPSADEERKLSAVLRCDGDLLIAKATPDNRGKVLRNL